MRWRIGSCTMDVTCLLMELERLIDSGMPVIVEGKKDRLALESLGLSNIFELSREPIFSLAERVGRSSPVCAVLTDLDAKGKQLYRRLKSGLSQNGVRIDDGLRNEILRSTRLSHIEGLSSFIETCMLSGNRGWDEGELARKR